MGKTLRIPVYIVCGLGFLLTLFWATPGDSYARTSTGVQDEAALSQADVSFVQPANRITEGASTLIVEVRLRGSLDSPLTLQVVLQPNLSTASGDDFASEASRALRFEAGAGGTTKSVTFDLHDDSEFEGEEYATFVLKELQSADDVNTGSPAAHRVAIEDNDRAGVVINEIQPITRSDIDGDGQIEGEGEGFVELLNTEPGAVDLTGWRLTTGSGTDFLFPAGTVLAGGSALVIFNSERPAGWFGGSQVIGAPELTADGNGDRIVLHDTGGNRIDSHRYQGQGGRESSLVRSPEGRGAFTDHRSAGRALNSPGLASDGSYFSSSLALSGDGGWHLLSAPSPSMTLSDLLQYVPVRGFQGYSPIASRTLYTGYDGETFTAPDRLSGSFRPGHGFMVYLEPGQERSAGTVILQSGENAVSAGNTTVELHSSGDGWNLLGNPFGTPLNLRDLGEWARGGELASSVAQVWDARSNTFRLATTTGNRLEAWQGLFIQNRSAATLEFPASARIEAGGPASTEIADNRYLSFSLHGEDEGGERTVDRAAVLTFSDGASHGWDRKDASKLRPLAETWALVSITGQREGRSVYKAQDSRPRELEGGLQIPLDVHSQGVSGNMELRWDLNALPDNWDLLLTDRVNGREIDLRSRGSYSFEHNGNADPNRRTDGELTMPELELPAPDGQRTPRFGLSVQMPSSRTAAEETPESVRLNPMYPNPFSESTAIPFELSENAHVRLTVWNNIGMIVTTIIDRPMSTGQHEEVWNPANDIPQGNYFIRLEVDGKLYSRQVTYINQ